MKNTMKIVAVLLVVLMAFGCSNAQQAEQKKVEAGVKSISADELVKLQAAGVKVVDVRTLGEVQQGKIPGAAHIEIGGDLVERMAGYAKDKPVILYCQAGGRSARAAEMLEKAGYTTVYNYAGGMADWRSKGKKLE